MQRRDFVKAMMAASVAAKGMLGEQAEAQQAATPTTASAAAEAKALPAVAPAPVPWMHGLMEAKPLPMTPLVPDAVAQTNANFFTDRQFATLQRFSEIMVPRLQRLSRSHRGRSAQVSRLPHRRLAARSPAHVSVRTRPPQRRSHRKIQRRFRRSQRRTGRPAHSPLAPHLDGRQSAHRALCALHQRRPHRYPRGHNEFTAWSDAQQAKGQSPRVDLYWYPVDPDLHRDSFAPIRRATPSHRPA